MMLPLPLPTVERNRRLSSLRAGRCLPRARAVDEPVVLRVGGKHALSHRQRQTLVPPNFERVNVHGLTSRPLEQNTHTRDNLVRCRHVAAEWAAPRAASLAARAVAASPPLLLAWRGGAGSRLGLGHLRLLDLAAVGGRLGTLLQLGRWRLRHPVGRGAEVGHRLHVAARAERGERHDGLGLELGLLDELLDGDRAQRREHIVEDPVEAEARGRVQGEPADHERQKAQRVGDVLLVVLALVDGIEGAEQLEGERLGGDEDDGDRQVRQRVLPPQPRHAVHPAVGQPREAVPAVGDGAGEVGDP
eukprot:scaffold21907_cov57-Phaeocystis_antarctica.AAC.10